MAKTKNPKHAQHAYNILPNHTGNMQTTIFHLSSHCQQACCPSKETSKAEFVWTPVGWGSAPIPSAFWPVCKNQAAAEIGVENWNESGSALSGWFLPVPCCKKKWLQLLIPQDLPLLHHYHHELFLFYIATTDTSPNCGTITAVGWNRNYHVLYPSLDFCLSCKHSPAQTYVFLRVSQRHNNLHKVIHTDV